MKAKFSKVLASVLALTLIFTQLVVTSSAEALEKRTNDTIDPSLAEALGCVEIQKEEYGLSNEDFYALRIGEPIQTYVYSNDSFIAWQTLYPILSGKKLILWAVEVEGSYQISQGLVRELSSALDYDEAFAIVYDYDSVYLYSNGSFKCLGHFKGQDDSRSQLKLLTVSQDKLITRSLAENKEVNYLPGDAKSAKSQIYYGCNVDFVTQANPNGQTSYICWAATIACIVNYHNGTDWTATYVAADIKGPNFNQGVYPTFYSTAIQYFRNHNVGTYLPYTNAMPSTYSITDNLQHGYPLYSTWQVYNSLGSSTNIMHAMCIYGIYTTNNYISIMDPDNGFATVAADPNSGNGAGYCSYTYYDTTSGTYATLIDAIYSTSFSR